jgi:hypothetical protein
LLEKLKESKKSKVIKEEDVTVKYY